MLGALTLHSLFTRGLSAASLFGDVFGMLQTQYPLGKKKTK